MVLMAEKPRKAGRPRKNVEKLATIHTNIDPKLMDRIEAYFVKQRFRPTMRDFLELAVRTFLDNEDKPVEAKK